MKKKLNTKLALNKKTIAALNYDEMNSLRGGLTVVERTCVSDVKCCPAPQDPDTQ
ncbi:MAG: class I lanthipeptide [Candidatus Aminicenantes bacterium]|nr:class I lanthipeptide [Candidatus Aminicenantes bacterium]